MEMEFQEYMYGLTYEQINKFAEKQPEVNNVLQGLRPHILVTTLDTKTKNFQFIYINCQKEFKGYFLKLKFKQENFYDHLLAFVYALSLEFEVLEPVQAHNDYLYQYRTWLE